MLLIYFKKTRNDLWESRKKYRILVENADEAIFIAKEGRLVFGNSKAEELSGYAIKELTSKPFTEFIHAEDREFSAG